MSSEQEIVAKRNIWRSTDEDDEIQNNELSFWCFKCDLEVIRNKGFQKPKFTIYSMIFCSTTSILVITYLSGYAKNWEKFAIAYIPFIFSQIGLQLIYFQEFLQPQVQKTKLQKFLKILIKIFLGNISTFCVVYGAIFKPLFNSPALYMTLAFPNTFFIFFVICVASNYDDLPHTYFSAKNNINNNFPPQNFNIESKKNIQYYKQTSKNSRFKFNVDEFDEWKELKQRSWTAIVTSIMYIDVVSDVYYGCLLFYTYRALSAFMRISSIALIACSAADLFYVFFMLLFPGWVSHFAHTVAFVMELPNFVLTGISIWKAQQLINQNLVEDNQSQQLAIFSIITTSLNALIHITYIMDRWAVKNAIEFIQQQ